MEEKDQSQETLDKLMSDLKEKEKEEGENILTHISYPAYESGR